MLAKRSVLLHFSVPLLTALGTFTLPAAEHGVDPTFLYRRVDQVKPHPSDVTTSSCNYKPLFGEGDSQTRIVRGVARFGEMIVDPHGESARVSYPAEEQAYFVLSGSGVIHYGKDDHAIAAEDFLYLPPGVEHAVSNPNSEPLRIVVMGYHIPKNAKLTVPEKLLIGNTSMAKQQLVSGHPESTLYKLLMGDTSSKRDVLAAANVLTSLFIMDIKPGGTNEPHHHEIEEEIYLVLEGQGDMVAGGGLDGIEGRHPATAGDAYFIRLNATVGFYADNSPGAHDARILAVRSRYPFPSR